MFQHNGTTYSHVTSKEAHCPCGCGLISTAWVMGIADVFINAMGFPIKINCMDRCDKYNLRLGGFKQSPHIIRQPGYGAIDFSYGSRTKITNTPMFLKAFYWFEIGIINHIEICDRHLHIANIPGGHVLAGIIQEGSSKNVL